MRYTKIATAKPFEGALRINMADVFGASPNKPIILRIPVTGERPITYGALNLPEGLALENGIITGQVKEEGNYEVTLTAENVHGKTEKVLNFEIAKDTVLLTPLMGFTSWNAFGADVSQEKMMDTAEKMVELGISEYGYSYINTDSGWQNVYGGKYDAIMPNDKFPDMKAMCDHIHSHGFKCGIYSTPMLTAWGCPKEFESIPGCTCGEPDIMFGAQNGGIGVIRKEKNNALQWAEWGFDYLKYDWTPTDPYNSELMRKELIATERDFGYCVTITASVHYHPYWSKYCNSYRNNCDAHGTWDNLLDIYKSYVTYVPYINKGHYFDLDMLDVGTSDNAEGTFILTEDEKIVAYSMRAFFNSPIQISSQLEHIDEFELSLYCNEEIIAINQDSAFSTAVPFIMEVDGEKVLHIYKKELSNGDYALAIFNMGETKETVDIDLEGDLFVRDVWAKEDMGRMNKLSVPTYPHTVRIFRVSK